MNWKSFLAAAMLTVVALPALADPRDDALQAVSKCAAIADGTARLACYDAAAPGVKDALAAPAPEAAPPAQVAEQPPTPEEQESWFGRNIGGLFGSAPEQQTTPEAFGSDRLPTTQAKVEDQKKELESITQKLTDYAFTPFGKVIVFLDNGQVWRQLQGDPERLYLKKNPGDNSVTISRGLLGSYDMTANDGSKSIKVTRVK